MVVMPWQVAQMMDEYATRIARLAVHHERQLVGQRMRYHRRRREAMRGGK